MTRTGLRLAAGCASVVLCLTGIGGVGVAFGQEAPRFLWGPGTPRYAVIPGGDPSEALRQAAVQTNVPLWQGSFSFNGQSFPYVMVGTDPAAGSATSTIPVVIVPIRFVFLSNLSMLSASDPVCGGALDAVTLAVNSPLFQNYPFSPGGVDVGTTQYTDAFQRANFWADVSTTSPDYHVLLTPSVAPTRTVLVPRLKGSVQPGPCAQVGKVDINYFDFFARFLISRLQIPRTSLPLFVTYNTFLTDHGGCCILGYHSATLAGQTYAVAAYSDAGLFNAPIEDIHAMSHELGEWLDDPFGANPTPGWMGGQATMCQKNLEVGDPVTGIAFDAFLDGVTYHPEDLVFLSWFARESPSTAAGGLYTFLGSYASPPAVCQ